VFEVKISREFSAAHRVEDYPGNCEKLHGHNWRVEVFVKKERLDELGMVVDFRKLKRLTEEAVASLDHSYLNELPVFEDINPTAENIARHIYEELSGAADVSRVTVWESDTSAASYFEESGA